MSTDREEDSRHVIIDVEVEDMGSEEIPKEPSGKAFVFQTRSWKGAVLMRLFFLLGWLLLSVFSALCLAMLTVFTLAWLVTGCRQGQLNVMRIQWWRRFLAAIVSGAACVLGVLSPTLATVLLAYALALSGMADAQRDWFNWMSSMNRRF